MMLVCQKATRSVDATIFFSCGHSVWSESWRYALLDKNYVLPPNDATQASRRRLRLREVYCVNITLLCHYLIVFIINPIAAEHLSLQNKVGP